MPGSYCCQFPWWFLSTSIFNYIAGRDVFAGSCWCYTVFLMGVSVGGLCEEWGNVVLAVGLASFILLYLICYWLVTWFWLLAWLVGGETNRQPMGMASRYQQFACLFGLAWQQADSQREWRLARLIWFSCLILARQAVDAFDGRAVARIMTMMGSYYSALEVLIWLMMMYCIREPDPDVLRYF